jgi:hypothetical protein
MGILASKSQKGPSTGTKRRSAQLDFANLAPLKPGGTVGFSSFRDNENSTGRNKSRKKSNGTSSTAMVEDSDEDDDEIEIVGKMEDIDDKDIKIILSSEEAKSTGEIADGVGRIKVSSLARFDIPLTNIFSQLKRQHSAEPLNANSRKSPGSIGSNSLGTTPPAESDMSLVAKPPTLPSSVFGLPDDSVVGSPLKKHRASLHDMDNETMQNRLGMGFSSGQDVVAAAEADHTPLPEPAMKVDPDEEEL